MQYPEENREYPSDVANCYGWLIQFADGNRLDLHVQTLSWSLRAMGEDRMFRILYDKDGCLAKAPEPASGCLPGETAGGEPVSLCLQ